MVSSRRKVRKGGGIRIRMCVCVCVRLCCLFDQKVAEDVGTCKSCRPVAIILAVGGTGINLVILQSKPAGLLSEQTCRFALRLAQPVRE
jgi:hypothetical protein